MLCSILAVYKPKSKITISLIKWYPFSNLIVCLAKWRLSHSNIANVSQCSNLLPHRHLPQLGLHHLAANGFIRNALLSEELKIYEPVLEDGLADVFESGVHAAVEFDFVV